jgi:hypothetical protein
MQFAEEDCFVASAPRNDGLARFGKTLNVIASEAKQSRATKKVWIASSQVLLAMTNLRVSTSLSTSLRAKRSNPERRRKPGLPRRKRSSQ